MQRIVVVLVCAALASACGGPGNGKGGAEPVEPADPVVARVAAAADAACACEALTCVTDVERELAAWSEVHGEDVERALSEPPRAAQLDRHSERELACRRVLVEGASAEERAAVMAEAGTDRAIVHLDALVSGFCRCQDVLCAERMMKAIYAEDEPAVRPTKAQAKRLSRLADRLQGCQQRQSITSAQLARWHETEREIARGIARRLAFDAYFQWAILPRNHGKCPTLAELARFIEERSALTDPWDNPYQVLCGADVPAGVRGIAVYSLGADGRAGTSDDLRSWEY